MQMINAASLKPSHTLIVSVAGKEKTGKTTFGLSAPKPLAVFDFDAGLGGVVDQRHDKDRIDVAEFRRTTSLTMSGADEVQEAKELLEDFITAYEYALKHYRSILFDTATEVWETIRLARLGRLEKVPPLKYTEINTLYRKILRMATDARCNLILLHKIKKAYKGNDWDGTWEPSGFADTPYASELNLFSSFDGSFKLRVVDDATIGCRHNYKLAGHVFDSDEEHMEMKGEDLIVLPSTTFPVIAMNVFRTDSAMEWL